jgi:hypothetical protein
MGNSQQPDRQFKEVKRRNLELHFSCHLPILFRRKTAGVERHVAA